MSKAEEKSQNRYSTLAEKYAFMDGYEQAERDLALTLEDMRELYIIFAEVKVDIKLDKIGIRAETLEYYQEVLNRFNKEKGE